MNRKIELLFVVLISVAMSLMFIRLYVVHQKDFEEVPARLAAGSIMNLNDPNPGDNIATLLKKGFYFKDDRDAALVSSVIEKGLRTKEADIDNIGELNKKRFSINADDAYKTGGQNFKRRVTISRTLVGFSDTDTTLFDRERNKPLQVSAVTRLALGTGSISGNINKPGNLPAAGVLVRLRLILPQDSVYSASVSEVENLQMEYKNAVRSVYALDSLKNRQLQSLTAYARTDQQGKFSFEGLQQEKAYQVLPLQPGFQFGQSKGITELQGDVTFNFLQSPHNIRLFSTRDFNNFKKEKSFIVRTPIEASNWFWIILVGYILSFFLLHVLLSVRFPQADQLLLPVVMFLTGLSFLALLSLQDPLRDRFLARSTFYYFLGGIGGMVIMSFINMRFFTPDSSLYRLLIFKNNRKAANGWPWAIAAMGLLLLTIFFGTGPEGSGVKVNLLGFQPSELVKYLVIIFLAGFFAVNEKFISEYTSFTKRLWFFFFALFAVVATIFLFLILGDLGPAMVCCFTFIILFSFSRGDFAPMAASVTLFVLTTWFTKNVWLGTGITVVVALLWMAVAKKRLSESVVMALVVVSGFMLLDQVPFIGKIFPGPVQRLTDRKAIWQNPWDNEVFGGDQVANGIWAMAGGGIDGQGIGEGFAKTIPEAHTDMILPAVGEEMGGAGIIAVFIVFFIYLHRSIIIGRQTGTPFLFYLSAGIGIGTFIQFLLIAGGSTGALPLSGVALPFISYGGSSLIANMVAAGFLLSASQVQGSAAQMKFITGRQDKNLLPALLAACTGIVLLGVKVFGYIENNAKWVVEPALVADRSGTRMFSYNPRINILMNRLQAGNLLDRKGMILATSNPSQIKPQTDSLLALGFTRQEIEALEHSRSDRYYPFGDQMFFWTGDANTGVFNGSVNGYFAEYAHAAELRGFPAPAAKSVVNASRYREDKFLPRTETEMTVNKRDYSALSPLLLAGINSAAVTNFKQRDRDVKLSLDAGLQTELQRRLATDDSVQVKRVSVVVMQDDNGDVLASAAYPLPPVNDWDLLTLSEAELNRFPGWNVNSDMGFTHATQPGSTAKLATSLAAFNKLGAKAADLKILVHPKDLIRIKSAEPDEAGYINIERGIIKSNNSFFIRLANEEQLQEQMAMLYMQTGMFLHGVGGYYYQYENNNTDQQNKWLELWRKTEFRSLRSYDRTNIRRTRGKGISGMAWGQGELIATPASVARLAGAIANKGLMVPNRYVLTVSGKPVTVQKGIPITSNGHFADLMTTYMQEQSANKTQRLGVKVAGKTGTPERIWKSERINDGWYVFFMPKANGKGHIVTCIRLENAKGSSEAVRLAGQYVIPVLLKRGYIKGFDPAAKAQVKSNVPAAVTSQSRSAVNKPKGDSIP